MSSPLVLQRSSLKRIVFDEFHDWPGLLAAIDAAGFKLERRSIERYFAGTLHTPRTLSILARLLRTAPDALLVRANAVALTAPPSRPNFDAGSALRIRDRDAYRAGYRFWTEMTTRKVALPIDTRRDLVVEIYDSWYAFFHRARDIAAEIPMHKDPQAPAVRQLVAVCHAVLNDGLRPHLEVWHRTFRLWLASAEHQTALGSGSGPQEAQTRFPQWGLLHADLMAANQRAIGYLAILDAMLGHPATLLMKGRRNPAA